MDHAFKTKKIPQTGVLDFTATWCGPCKTAKPVLESFSASHGVPLTFIDVDEESELAQEYKVTSIPYIVFLHNGNVTASITGFDSKKIENEFLSLKKKIQIQKNQIQIPKIKEAEVKV